MPDNAINPSNIGDSAVKSTAYFDRVLKVFGDLAKAAKGTLIVILSTVLILSLLYALKWALGIQKLERQVATLIEELRNTEDTIYSFRDDFLVPNVDDVYLIFERNDIELDPIELVGSGNYGRLAQIMVEKNISDEFINELNKIYINTNRPVDREFRFSAAKNATVILDYEFECVLANGEALNTHSQPRVPSDFRIPYSIEVNGEQILASAIPSRRISVTQSALDSGVSSEDGGHAVSTHNLRLTAFSHGESRAFAENAMRMAMRVGARSCMLDALLIVRDVPTEVDSPDLTTLLERRLQ